MFITPAFQLRRKYKAGLRGIAKLQQRYITFFQQGKTFHVMPDQKDSHAETLERLTSASRIAIDGETATEELETAPDAIISDAATTAAMRRSARPEPGKPWWASSAYASTAPLSAPSGQDQ
jgi:hypothetical protein